MEPEGSLSHSKVPATCPYPGPAQSSPYLHIPLPEDPFNSILPSKPGSPQWSPSSRFPHQNPVHASPPPPYAPHDFRKKWNIRYHECSSGGRRVVLYRRTDRKTDITKVIVALIKFANAPKIYVLTRQTFLSYSGPFILNPVGAERYFCVQSHSTTHTDTQ